MAAITSEEGGMVGCMVHRPPEGSGGGAGAYLRERPDLGREGIDEAQARGDRVVGQILEERPHAAGRVRARAVGADGERNVAGPSSTARATRSQYVRG